MKTTKEKIEEIKELATFGPDKWEVREKLLDIVVAILNSSDTPQREVDRFLKRVEEAQY